MCAAGRLGRHRPSIGECGVEQVVEQPELFAQQQGAVEAAVLALDFLQRGELADALLLGRFEQRPAGALDPAPVGWGVSERSWRPFLAWTWSTARAPSLTTWKGSKQISASGTAWRMARWYPLLMSIGTARIEAVSSPGSAKKACNVARSRPCWRQTTAPVRWSAAVVG